MAFNDPPKGTCDMCKTKKAAYWFGQTSVALCGDKKCSEQNAENWKETCRQADEDRRREEEGW